MDKEQMARIREKAHYICPVCNSENIFVNLVADVVIDCHCNDCKAGWTVSVREILNA